MIAIVDVDEAHGGFEMVHAKIFIPIANPVMVVFSILGLVIIPVPEINVQYPVPTVGVLAAIVVVGDAIQSVCVGPAFDTEGISFTIKATVAVEAKHGGFEIVHAKTFVPNPKPVIVVFSIVGFVIIPLPETKVHIPVPTVGVFAAIVAELDEIQSVCVDPAFAVVGIAFTSTDIVEDDAAQGGLEIVH
jgi:hypothetical protein